MSWKLLTLTTVGTIALIVGIAFIFGSSQNAVSNTAAYSTQDTDRPKVEVKENFSDVGEISVNDNKQVDFELKNIGSKPLQITNVSTSCHCTFGQIVYKGETTKEFGMSNQSQYVMDVAPGDTAIVRLIYRPSIMPVYGLVEREVYVSTNDPANQKLIFSIKAKVK